MGIKSRKRLSNGLLKVGVWVYKYIFLLEPKLHAYAVTSFITISENSHERIKIYPKKDNTKSHFIYEI